MPVDDTSLVPFTPANVTVYREFERDELIELDLEYLGGFLKDHPMLPVAKYAATVANCELAELEDDDSLYGGDEVVVVGCIVAVETKTSRRGSKYYTLTLEDLSGRASVLVFDSVAAATRVVLAPLRIAVIKAKISDGPKGRELVAQEIVPLVVPRE